MTTPLLTKEEICKMFNCSLEQLNSQYAANAETLKQMHSKALKTGKKVNQYTASQLGEYANKYEALSK